MDPTGIASLTSFGYDAVGNVTSVTDPRLYVTENQYDADRRKTVVLHHNGAITAAVIAAEQTTYDVLGRATMEASGIAFSGVTVSTWQTLKQTFYTPTSKIYQELDGAGDTTTYSYDPMDRVQIVLDPANRRVASVYDLAGQTLYTWRGWNSATPPIASTAWNPSTYAGSGPIRYAAYSYSLNGKQTSIQDANNNVTQIAYDGFDRTRLTLFADSATGTLCTYASSPVAGYDSATATPACTGQQAFEQYGYDANGNRTSLLTRDGQTIGYVYDKLGRETIKQLPGPTSGYVYLSYDLAGRPLSAHFGSLTGTGVDYGYDTAKRLTSENTFGRAMGYQYDPANNRTVVTWPDNNYVNHDFDALNREWQIRENGAGSGVGLLAVYQYDALSRPQSITRGTSRRPISRTTIWHRASKHLCTMSWEQRRT